MASMSVLMTAGADVNARNRRGATALTGGLADPAKVRLLMENGAALDGRTAEGRAPPHIAAASGSEVLLRARIAAGGNVNAVSGAVRMLLESGADPSRVKKRNLSALASASHLAMWPRWIS